MLPSVADYRDVALRRLPRFAFDYLEGAAEDGDAMHRNLDSYRRILLRPRVLRDLTHCSTETTWFGRTQAAPMAVGPTGLNGLFWPKADELLAAAAAQRGLPFILSTASTSLLEDVRSAAPGADLWLQLYVQRDRGIAEDIMRRAGKAGYRCLVMTVDTPVHGKRDHDLRNGFKLPIRLTPALARDVLRRPRWAWQMLRNGGPQLLNIARSLGEAPELARQAATLSRAMDLALQWDDISWARRHWNGPVLIKGIQTIEDAQLAARHGADGIVLSNHGGRQLGSAAAPLDVLPSVRNAVGERLRIFVDGGVRRGADAIKAVACGADGVLLGRAPLYGLAASGSSGVNEVLALLLEEAAICLRLLGCTCMGELDSTHVQQIPLTALMPAPTH
ncbi:alpha-hydroxy acid oxidase [Bordetella sp. 2513F-2]